ncbi:MAG: MFS transporter [Proteobacteria bacterium]|nr:MFS transporter [Pseudomonadota bacterium]
MEPQQSKPGTAPPLPRSVWLLSWVSFFADVSGEMIYPLIPLFIVVTLGASKTDLGLIEGAAVMLVSLMAAVAGSRSDAARKRVPWIRWGYALPVLGKGLMAVATVWPSVMAGRLLDRFGKGLRGAPRDALIVDAVLAAHRGRAFGLHRAFDTAGALLGVLLSALLLWLLTGTPSDLDSGHAVSGDAIRIIFGIAAAVGLTALALTFFIQEATPSLTLNCEAHTHTQLQAIHWRTLPRSYWRTLVVLALFSLANSSDTFLLLRAHELGCKPWEVVLLYALFNLSYAGLSYPAGAWSDGAGRWRVIGLGWALYAAVYLAFALLTGRDLLVLAALMTMYGAYMALTEGVAKALIADYAPANQRGAALGLFLGVTGITSLLASLLAGALWDFFGARIAFLAGAICALAALLKLRMDLIGESHESHKA